MTLIFHGGDIVSLDPELSDADALGVRDGRIAAIGGREEIARRLGGGEIRHVDLAGRSLVPSFKDHHVHVVNVGMSLFNRDEGERLFLDLAGAASADDIVERVAERARQVPAGHWVLGKGWNQHDWGSNDLPDHRPLSRAAPGHPVMLGRIDAHCVWVNVRALERAGISAATPEPPGGAIPRLEDGSPSGILLERAAEPLLAAIPATAGWEVSEAFRRGIDAMAAAGVTEVYDAGFLDIAAIVNLELDFAVHLELLRWLETERRLPLRVNLMVPAPSRLAEEIVRRPDEFRELSADLGVTHIKLYADGAFGSRGAALTHPYHDDASTRGVLRMSRDELDRQVRRALDAGLDVATHAIGDEAVHLVLEAYQAAVAVRPELDPRRLRIEHFGYAASEDIRRAADAGFMLVAQPNFIVPDDGGVPMEERRLGPERCARVYPWRTLSSLGANLAGSSDYFTAPGPPLWDFYAAATRMSPAGTPSDGWQPQERLGREDSLRLVTTLYPPGGGEPTGGSLREGEPADLAILSANPLEAPESEILDIRVHATLRRGNVTHHDGSMRDLGEKPS